MRVIAVKTLKSYFDIYPEGEGPVLAWYQETARAEWKNHNELKAQFGNASVIGSKRVVFNIHGNSFRLLVDIEYKFQLVFVVWFGTHKEYDKIDAKNIKYAKTN